MSKYPEPINDFDFIVGKTGNPTWRHKRKMISGDLVPEEIKVQLLKNYEDLNKSDKVQAEREEAKASAEQAAADAEEIINQVEIEKPEGDDAGSPEQSVLPESAELEGMRQRLEKAEAVITELTKSSIYDASLEIIAYAMLQRFNVYTVFAGHHPADGDISPFKGTIMTQFERGGAYRDRMVALNTGSLENISTTVSASFSQAVEPMQAPNARVEPLPQKYKQTTDPRIQSNMTGDVKNAETYGIDGVIQDPPVHHRQAIIDPTWRNKSRNFDPRELDQR